MKKIVCLTLLLTPLLTGCLYKMPTDDVVSTLPTTNNPQFTGEKPRSFMPG